MGVWYPDAAIVIGFAILCYLVAILDVGVAVLAFVLAIQGFVGAGWLAIVFHLGRLVVCWRLRDFCLLPTAVVFALVPLVPAGLWAKVICGLMVLYCSPGSVGCWCDR